jgi:hypothetical protein
MSSHHAAVSLSDSFFLLDLPELPCPALPCPALPCPALPCPALPCPALPCPALPCPAPPNPAPPQALLNIEGTGSCSTAGTAAVQQSVLDYMQRQPGVNELKVDVQCFDSQAGTGRRLHQV